MSELKSDDEVLVDTDVYSYLGKPNSKFANLYLPHVDQKRLAVSFSTVGELYFGAHKKKWSAERIADMKDRLRSVAIVPYDEGVCRTYGEIKARLEEKGMPIADNDLWIVACAIRHSIPLVSNNRSHVERVPGLVLKSEAKAMTEIMSQMRIEAKEEIRPSPTAPVPPSSL